MAPLSQLALAVLALGLTQTSMTRDVRARTALLASRDDATNAPAPGTGEQPNVGVAAPRPVSAEGGVNRAPLPVPENSWGFFRTIVNVVTEFDRRLENKNAPVIGVDGIYTPDSYVDSNSRAQRINFKFAFDEKDTANAGSCFVTFNHTVQAEQVKTRDERKKATLDLMTGNVGKETPCNGNKYKANAGVASTGPLPSGQAPAPTEETTTTFTIKFFTALDDFAVDVKHKVKIDGQDVTKTGTLEITPQSKDWTCLFDANDEKKNSPEGPQAKIRGYYDRCDHVKPEDAGRKSFGFVVDSKTEPYIVPYQQAAVA
ncbi:MAG: hypothetical protein M1833_004108 [Piccolia ochrophora]|nr:MAG: hypothetical protein M1833_004108 [Piccolia ochrophora]